MIDLTNFNKMFDELDRQYPIVNELCGGPVGFSERKDDIVIDCTDCSDGYTHGFISCLDCFDIADYFNQLGHLLLKINKECKKNEKR